MVDEELTYTLNIINSEIPVERSYPKGKIPTKISPLKGNLQLIKILLNLYLHKYDFKNNMKVIKEEQ
ncbi:hypothetical protein PPSC2_22680 [Paenibacillus polymyxa SC2]|uniref:Uncharacterized protein n=1 Tax=Paenibacillus polymyxa (strain SC2) TaxID=886882 RepID=E3EAL1_PAEPS|nr:hypothetical protein PPSC2_22680 [Paenibacillus polymyxa SC2]KZE68290.1 hypothetical protein AV545_22305 [Paenibacillus jamilae]